MFCQMNRRVHFNSHFSFVRVCFSSSIMLRTLNSSLYSSHWILLSNFTEERCIKFQIIVIYNRCLTSTQLEFFRCHLFFNFLMLVNGIITDGVILHLIFLKEKIITILFGIIRTEIYSRSS